MRFSITMNWSDSLIGGQEQNWGFAHCLHCNAHALLQIHTERATERERDRESRVRDLHYFTIIVSLYAQLLLLLTRWRFYFLDCSKYNASNVLCAVNKTKNVVRERIRLDCCQTLFECSLSLVFAIVRLPILLPFFHSCSVNYVCSFLNVKYSFVWSKFKI